MPTIRRPRNEELEELLDLWLRSVRATHSFLDEDDVVFYHPMVRELLASDLELWAAYDDAGDLVGFMALDGPDRDEAPQGAKAKLEALFIDPARLRQGFGELLTRRAIERKGPLALDVNEHNPGALAFYRRMGFTETGRSPCDGAGKPFPLIHMELL